MASRFCMRMRGSRVGLLGVLLCGLGGLPLPALALGLGEIVLDSALNERLAARIPLVDAGGLQPDEIRVSLASAEDFERVGVERFFFLSDLEFRVEMADSGRGVVEVSTSKAITEPYLNFLVQVQWPQGRLMKEFTLLLDPPTFSAAPAPAVSTAVQAAPGSVSAGAIERAPEPVVVPEAPPAAAPPVATERPAGVERAQPLDSERMTDRQDTLWSIARAARPSEAVSIQQTMLAIQRLNPDAFLDGNINRLKAGYVLQMPTEEQGLEVGAAEALEQVASQDRSWRGQASTAAAPADAATEPAAIDATPEPDAAAPATGGPEGRLRIVAGEGDSAAGGAAPEAVVDQAALAAAQEERDRLNLEVADLTSQLDREKELAASQIAVKDRQLEIKDQQIAEMEAELTRLRETAGGTPTDEQKQDQSASAPAEAWWQSPAVLGGGAGTVVLLLAGALIAARRRRGSAVAQAPSFAMPGRVAAEPVIDREPRKSLRSIAEATELPAAAPGEIARAGVAGAVAAGAASTLAAGAGTQGAELVDVIGEADIYIAYGRYGQALGLLQTALVEAPDRHDVRLKLLDVYARTGDRAAFDRMRAELDAHTSDPEVLDAAERLERGFGAAFATALADSGAMAPPASRDAGFLAGDLDVQPLATTEPMLATLDLAAEPQIADDALALDEFEVDLSEKAAAADSTAERSDLAWTPGQSADVELEFELDEAAIEPAAVGGRTVSGESAAPLPGLEFDLDLDDADAPAGSAALLDEPLPSSQGGILGGDRGIEFRLEAEDLEALDDAELALEMDALPDLPEAEDEFDFPDEGDSASTKLDLARAYSEMGDAEGAREILLEVLKEGSASHQQAARELLERL